MSEPMNGKRTRLIRVEVTSNEKHHVQHAAGLRGLTTSEYVKRAINAQLRREGVDAVLIRQSDEVE